MKPIFASVVATLAGAGALLAIAPSSAQAHAYLVESFPSAKQRVVKPLSEIKLLFSGRADAHFSTVKLKSDDGAVLAETTQQEASREIVLPTPTLPPGEYRVDYRVLSSDGDIVEGKVDFIIDG